MSTDRAEFATTGVNHAEGGWARDINPQDVEQTSRFKKKVEKDDMYMSSVLQLGAVSGRLCVVHISGTLGYFRVLGLFIFSLTVPSLLEDRLGQPAVGQCLRNVAHFLISSVNPLLSDQPRCK